MANSTKTIVLTGGGGFLGTAMTKKLTSDGHRVAVVDRDLATATLSANGAYPNGLGRAYSCDVSDRDALVDLKKAVENDFGEVDVLICGAATKSDNFFEPFETFPLEDWDYVMRVNLTGPAMCAQVFGGPMAVRGNGAIVNILSIYGVAAPDQRIYDGALYEGHKINTPAIYSASKAGLWGLTKYLASYWGDQGVRVNAVTPGGIFSGQNDKFVDNYSARTMVGRMGEPHEIADAVAYLASDQSSYVTGQNLIVDGGLTAW
ncbi:SDR family oxidoreductase [Loktanella sp. F6476L]|uniref:SDR family oxidoreductase n=1 Tax=Loktanella sp. F6476L TaxID=2926405 RepID=UPI001FF33063|nr:SDR family oxidoreductase [Loktanella sp. F6476L]MCK0122127.1 SDR family oxidoreductase [Loktanella sp. F6476L]